METTAKLKNTKSSTINKSKKYEKISEKEEYFNKILESYKLIEPKTYRGYKEGYIEKNIDGLDSNQIDNYFYPVPYIMLLVDEFTITDVFIYSLIYKYTIDDAEGHCWITNDEIAKRLNISTRWVIKSLQRLKDSGVINIKYKDGKKDRNYRIITIETDFYTNGEGKSYGFIKVYYRMFNYPKLTKELILFYSYICALSSIPEIYNIQKGFCKITIKQIENRFGFSKPSIIKFIHELNDLGLIRLLEKSHMPYYIKPLIDFSKPQKEELDLLEERSKTFEPDVKVITKEEIDDFKNYNNYDNNKFNKKIIQFNKNKKLKTRLIDIPDDELEF